MILSIGMIVKNEEKYLERCLSALKPILDELDSELIIADTGSTDNSVEIAKKFTDNVFHFEWINDFSAARNSTLEKAGGEWYMFIDADEILRDCSDLIRFFKSGEYKKYGSGAINIRSYLREGDSETYTDALAYRLTKKREDVSFVNPIHEGLHPPIAPCKNLAVIADHYGYIFYTANETNALSDQKTKRNLEILFKELEDGNATGNVRSAIYNQIASCCSTPEEALKYLNMGLERIPADELPIIACYSHKVNLLLILEKYNEIFEVCEAYFSPKNRARKKVLAADAYMYAGRGVANYYLGNFKQAIPDLLKGLDLYKKYTDRKLVTEDLLLGAFYMTKRFARSCYDGLLICCFREKVYDPAADGMKLFPVTDYLSDREYMKTYLLRALEVMEHTSYGKLPDLYYKLDSYNREQLVRFARWQIFETKKPEMLLKNLTDLANGDSRIKAIIEIFRGHFIKKNLLQEKINEYITEYYVCDSDDIWCVTLLANLDITPYITNKEFSFDNCAENLFLNYISPSDAANLFADYDIDKVSPNGLETAAVVYCWVMVETMQNGLSITRLFEKYGKIGLRWSNEFPDCSDIPGDIRAALMVNDITKARDRGDLNGCISGIQSFITACPPLAPMAKEYQKTVQSEARPAAPAVDPEFAQLAIQVKQNIRDMMAAGDLAEAESTLSELEELCPLDPEIELLKDELYMLKR